MTTTALNSSTPDIFAFSGVPGDQMAGSPIPRSEVVFNLVEVAVTAGGAEGQTVTFTMQPPLNYAYVLVDLFCAINAATRADALDWSNSVLGTVISGGPDGLTEVARINGWALSAVDTFRVYQFDVLPKRLFVPNTNSLSIASLVLDNPVVGGAAAAISVFARFMQYDIDQQHHYQVNTPTLTR